MRGRRRHNTPHASSSHGIKSGMTVQELKRLTQERMFASPVSSPNAPTRSKTPPPSRPPPPTPPPSSSRPPPPSLSSLSPGLTVQELKRLTNLRLAQAKPYTPPSYAARQQPPPPPPTSPLSPRSVQLQQVSLQFREGSLSQGEKARAKEIIIQHSMANDSTWSPTSPRRAKSAQISSFYRKGEYEKANNEMNKVLAPPPGLSRRPSMTVPASVAESVLGRKGSSPKGKKMTDITEESNTIDQRSSSKESMMGGGLGRRSSFGNAAQFFRHRRRSKMGDALFEGSDTLPGIDEWQSSMLTGAEEKKGFPPNSWPSSSNSAVGSIGAFGNETSTDSEEWASHLFSSMFGSTLGYDEDTQDVVIDSPMNSPSAEKLRKVAVLSRRGSLNTHDKTRAKDDIIQASLGADLAMISKIKLQMASRLHRARCNLETKSASSRTSSRTSSPVKSRSSSSSPARKSTKNDLEVRLAQAAKDVASCVSKGDMEGFGRAMVKLDHLKVEANTLMNVQ